MDLNSISSGAVAQNIAQRTGDAGGVTVARKAVDVRPEVASTLTSSDSKTPPASEPNLGNKVNTYA